MNYYNDNCREAAEWLRELIKARLIPEGEVDERSIRDVRGDDLKGFRQCHFFAGIAGWALALALAGWAEDEEVWTGSCPCQPFSAAGKAAGVCDERHLWPAFRGLIAERRPARVFGEQVASKDGRFWLAGVRTDLEGMGYAVGGADLCAAGVSAPMVSQRLHWVAEAIGAERRPPAEGRSNVVNREDAGRKKANGRCAIRGALSDGLGEANRYHEHWWSGPLQVGWNCIEGEIERGGRKYRAQWRVKPGLSLLADGIPGRVAQLCGFGNAIVPQLAAEFIKAYLESKGRILTA